MRRLRTCFSWNKWPPLFAVDLNALGQFSIFLWGPCPFVHMHSGRSIVLRCHWPFSLCLPMGRRNSYKSSGCVSRSLRRALKIFLPSFVVIGHFNYTSLWSGTQLPFICVHGLSLSLSTFINKGGWMSGILCSWPSYLTISLPFDSVCENLGLLDRFLWGFHVGPRLADGFRQLIHHMHVIWGCIVGPTSDIVI